MKKRLFLIPGLLILCAAAVLFLLAADGNTTVYVTNTGIRYHRENCTSLRSSKRSIRLEDAVRRGYGPCGICRPPVLSGSAAPETRRAPAESAELAHAAAQDDGLYRVNAAGLASSFSADLSQMVRAEVTGHVDGDTVKVRVESPPPELGEAETIRLIGVDTPETVHPSRPVQFFGKEASDYTKSRLLGKTVYLAFDWDLRDRYGRLLAYIYLDSGEADCFNAALVREGYAHAYTRFAFHFMEEFRALERDARTEKRGLWGNGS
ncbi:MAG: thermonuclease family protein [Treponema sp.]|nr:thermonuclease family protein [Treponema sp.]